MNKYMTSRQSQVFIVCLLVAIAILSRFIPHLENFTAVMAVALFAGAYFFRRRVSLLLPFAILFISDLLLHFQYLQGSRGFPGFYSGMIFTYLGLLIAVMIGWKLKGRVNVGNTFLASLSVSVSFFIVSNIGVWVTSSMYAKSLAGLIECFTMAIPFFRNALLGDLVFVGILFGGFEIINSIFTEKAYDRLNK